MDIDVSVDAEADADVGAGRDAGADVQMDEAAHANNCRQIESNRIRSIEVHASCLVLAHCRCRRASRAYFGSDIGRHERVCAG